MTARSVDDLFPSSDIRSGSMADVGPDRKGRRQKSEKSVVGRYSRRKRSAASSGGSVARREREPSERRAPVETWRNNRLVIGTERAVIAEASACSTAMEQEYGSMASTASNQSKFAARAMGNVNVSSPPV
jgi:hypothetical protein